MSLLIKGMDMPNDYKHRDVTLDRTTDDGILRLSVYDFDHEAMKYSCRVYSLTEIPTPHGRLIDADRLIAVLKSAIPHEQRTSTVLCMIKNIENAPTVIEAEG